MDRLVAPRDVATTRLERPQLESWPSCPRDSGRATAIPGPKRCGGAAAGDLAGAVVCLFAYQLLALDRLGLIRLAPGRTGGSTFRGCDDRRLVDSLGRDARPVRGCLLRTEVAGRRVVRVGLEARPGVQGAAADASGAKAMTVRLDAIDRLLLAGALLGLVLSVSGCADRGPETEYGRAAARASTARPSFAAMLREQRTRGAGGDPARRRSSRDWADGIVRFAPHPALRLEDEAAWYRAWLAADSEPLANLCRARLRCHRRILEGASRELPPTADPDLAGPKRRRIAIRPPTGSIGCRQRPSPPADHGLVHGRTAWNPPRVVHEAGWSLGRAASTPAAAALTVHEACKRAGQGLAGRRRQAAGRGKDDRRRARAAGDRQWIVSLERGAWSTRRGGRWPSGWSTGPSAERRRMAMVEGARLCWGKATGADIWGQMLRRMPDLRWACIQVSVAALLAALARAPRLGRPRPTRRRGPIGRRSTPWRWGPLLARDRCGRSPATCSIATAAGDTRARGVESAPAPLSGGPVRRHDDSSGGSGGCTVSRLDSPAQEVDAEWMTTTI